MEEEPSLRLTTLNKRSLCRGEPQRSRDVPEPMINMGTGESKGNYCKPPNLNKPYMSMGLEVGNPSGLPFY